MSYRASPRGITRTMTPTLRGETTPAAVRRVLTDARKAAAADESATVARLAVAQALRAASEEAATADEAALAAGQDVGADREAQAEAELRTAERRAVAAHALAGKAAAAVAPAIREAAPEWLPVLDGELEAALAEPERGALATLRDYCERVDRAATRYWFVRAVSERRAPSATGPARSRERGDRDTDPRPLLARMLAALDDVDALLGEYRRGIERADAAAAEREREDERRTEWEARVAREREREREVRRRRDAERQRVPDGAEVIR
jgi:hypothetical protein